MTQNRMKSWLKKKRSENAIPKGYRKKYKTQNAFSFSIRIIKKDEAFEVPLKKKKLKSNLRKDKNKENVGRNVEFSRIKIGWPTGRFLVALVKLIKTISRKRGMN